MNIVIVITALLTVTASATQNDTDPSHGRVPAGEINIEKGSSLNAAPVVLAPSIESPDPPGHDFELELIVENAEFGFDLLLKLAQVSKRSYEYVRNRARDEWLLELTERRSLDGDFLKRCQQLFERPGNILSAIFTDEAAALFLSRLQVAALDSPDAVLDLFTLSGIARIPSVVRLIPGWIVSVVISSYTPNRHKDVLGRFMDLVPAECSSISTDSIPEDVIQEGDFDYSTQFAQIDIIERSEDVILSKSKIIAKYIRSHPNLAKIFFFLGFPFCLSDLKLADFTLLELQHLLPFAIFADVALDFELEGLIESGRLDVIAAVMNCENFRIGDSFNIYVIMRKLIAGNQLDMLRALLRTPFRNGLLHDAASDVVNSYRCPILHESVRQGNEAAVLELLSIHGLIDVNLRDGQGRTARSYAADGSEIAKLLDDPSYANRC